MSIDIWPPIPPEELKIKEAETKERELIWYTQEVLEICRELKHGLEDCYALLAPIDPGSTLVMSTPRNEKVKGTITRVGTRIVKGTLNLQLRMTTLQSLTLSTSRPVHVPALDSLFMNLNQAIDLVGVLLDQKSHDSSGLASTLSTLSKLLSNSLVLLKGDDSPSSDFKWQKSSCPAHHFSPSLLPNFSFHIKIQDSCIVLALRVLEPLNAPVNFGTKFGLAIGTFRRLEHDEMDKTFSWFPEGDGSTELWPDGDRLQRKGDTSDSKKEMQEVWVREKVRVESADPSLISLYSKLRYLSHTLGQARRNLAVVRGVDFEAED